MLREHNLFRAALAVAMACALPLGMASAQVALPEIGDPTRSALSAADEEELREAFMREIHTHLRVVEDPEIEEYVQALGHRLAATSESAGRPFQFLVIDSPAINAFAGPGGIIAVNTGLIQASSSESELAAVVAHEIAHVTQRHLARAFEQAGRSNLPAMAALLAALVLASQSSEAGQAAIATLAARSAQSQLDFSRANEKEADHIGMQLLAAAGFDPRAMPAFFERLQRANRYSREAPEYLSTHPVTSSRIADSRNRAEQYPYRQFTDGLNYHLVRAKLKVRGARDPRVAVSGFAQALERGQHRSAAGTRYGLALALMAAKRWSEAREQLLLLLEHDGDRIPFRMALAEVETALGRRAAAMRIYEQAAAIYPTSKPLIHAYAVALLEAGEPRRALRVLTEYRRRRTPDAVIYRLLAEAQSGLGNRFESNVALAEHHYLNGDLDAAIHQLALALKGGSADLFGTARAEARLRQLRDEHALRAQIRRR